MTQNIFRWLSLLVLLISTTALPAIAEEGQIYTIKQGDTLWDISQKFIDDPYYWPQLWSNNPEITNPHLIFPGQKIRIIDGRLEIIPAYPEAENATPAEAANPTLEALPAAKGSVQIKSTGSGDGFILTTEEPLGFLVDSVDNRVLLTENDLVFLKMTDVGNVTIGDTYGLFSRGELITHPQTLEPIGTMMNSLGFLQVTDITGETVHAKIGNVYREIVRGAELFEYVPPRRDLTLQRGSVANDGYIIAARDEKAGQGTNDIVFVDLGSANKLDSGNLLYVSRPRQVSDEILEKAGAIDLPDEVLGAAVIIEVKENTASALIIKSADAMYIGDNVSVATD